MRRGIVTAILLAALSALLALPGSVSAFGLLSGYGSPGTGYGAGQLGIVTGMAVDQDGNVYLTDFLARRISVFAADGTFLRTFGKGVNPSGGNVCTAATGCQAGTASTEAGAFGAPTNVDIGPDGLLYIPDGTNNRIDVFAADGTFIRAFGKGVNPSGGNVCTTATGCQGGLGDGSAGSLYAPIGLGIDSGGTLYIATANNRIDVFSADGTFIHALGNGVAVGGGNICTVATGCQQGLESASAGGISNAWDIAVSSDGLLVVSDGNNNRVDIFTPEGLFLRAFGKEVNPSGGNVCMASTGCQQGKKTTGADGTMSMVALALDEAGNALIADTQNHRIDEFALDGTFIRAFGEGVIDGKSVFEVCTPETSCVKGGATGTAAGSTPNPFAVAVDCFGAIYVSTVSTAQQSPVKRFGEPTTGHPPCPEPASPPLPPPTQEAPAAGPVPQLRHEPVKPTFTVEINSGSGTATFSVAVSGLGTLWLHGKGIRSVKQRVKHVGLVELQVVPKGALKRKLERAGKAKANVLLTFTPDDGPSSTQAKSLFLKMPPRF